jgi:hypothetical protein
MHRQVSSLLWAVGIVAVALLGGTWLEDTRQFPWHLFVAVLSPALALVIVLGGGLHGVSAGAWVLPATAAIGVCVWYVFIEVGRGLLARWRQGKPTTPVPRQ